MSENFQTLKDIRIYLAKELSGIYPEEEIIAITNHILKTHLGIDRLHLFTNPFRQVTADVAQRIIEICDELKTGKPVQYILGETSFYNCTIKVNKDALIPRPETEELVDLIIKENEGFAGRIIDIGTGSGCIAIALSKNLADSVVTGIDISEKALELAKINAKLISVNITLINGDVFHFDPASVQPADIIVSNPPYVMESEKKLMSPNVLQFEPHNALFVADEDPLIFYRAIVRLSEKMLVPGGKIYFEINEKKGNEISSLLESAGFIGVKIINDINGKNRFVKGKHNGGKSAF
jgi:release factor glutamine methyltransferase